MPTALVTGATGFVGSHLVDHLIEKGYRVTATLRKTSRSRWLEGKPVEWVEADLTHPVKLPPCDILFHVAGVIRADTWKEYRAGNRDASLHAFEGARTDRFVQVSSLAVTGPGEGVTEDTPCAPISKYGKSKWEGEQEIWSRRDCVPVTVIRPPVVYGPRDFGLYDLYRSVAAGVRPDFGPRKVVSLVHVRDLVEGIVRAAELPAGANEIFFLADPRPRGVSELLKIVQRALERKALRVPLPDRVVLFLGALSEFSGQVSGRRTMFNRDKAIELTQKAWICDPAKARRLLGWEAKVDVERGMPETLAWYRTEGLL